MTGPATFLTGSDGSAPRRTRIPRSARPGDPEGRSLSRHRSPGGARVRHAPAATATTRRRGRCPGRRQIVAAAAVAGGTLALTVPLVTMLDVAAGDATTALRLSAAGTAIDDTVTPPRPAGLRTLLPVVATADDAVPEQADAAGLIKAAGLADKAAEAEAGRARAECGADVSGLGRVKPWVSAAARFLSCLYDHPDLIGVSGRGRVSDHPLGLAIDLMARGAQGDRIADCALRNREALGISYVIWKQRINYGNGWQAMANRGSATENHLDHVHISFERSVPGAAPDPARCS